MSTTGVDWQRVRGLDLVYQRDCWRLCGDAHCCSFARHKQRFRMLGKEPFQELPLLPGEYEFLRATDGLRQFGDHDHRHTLFAIDAQRAVVVESIVSRRPGCACDHATRPTICRLYPLFPVHDLDGRLLGIDDDFGIYEALERLAGLPRTCAIGNVPLDQLRLFLELAAELARSPVHLFHLHAYRLTRRHAVANLERRLAAEPQDVFLLFEWLLLKDRLLDKAALRAELAQLADAFAARYGERFTLPAPPR